MTSAAKANRTADIVDRLEAQNKHLREALERTLPVLAAAAAGASVTIAAGDIYRETRVVLGRTPEQKGDGK